MHPSSSGFALVLNTLLLAYKCETFQNNKLCVFMCVKLLPQTWKLNKWKSILRFQSISKNITTIRYFVSSHITTETERGKANRGEFSFAQRAVSIQTGGGYPGRFSSSVASLESKMLFDIYPKHGEVRLKAKAVFYFS